MKFKFKILLLIVLISQMMMACKSSLPTIDSFSGNRKVPQGEKTTLSWKVSNAKKVYLIDSITNEKRLMSLADNKIQFKPTTDFAYTLVIEDKNKQIIEKKFSGKVVKNPPIIDEFKGTTEYVVGEKAATPSITWKVRKAKKVFIKNYNEEVDKEKGKFFMPINLDTTQIITLLAIGEFGDSATAQHTIKVRKLEGNIRVSNKFGSPELIAGENNVLTWDFPGAESVEIENMGTFKATDTHIIVPKKEDRNFSAEMTVNYPNNKKTKVPISIAVVRVKYVLIPSKLRVSLYEKVLLTWKTEGAKKVKLLIGNDVYDDLEPSGKHTFTASKNTEVKLIVKDKYDEEHEIKWLIRCEDRRPFIKNAIDYQTFKKDDKEAIKKRLIFDIFQVDRSKFPNEIKLRILITDTLGNFIRGLAPPAITEKEAKKFFIELVESIGAQQQTITDFKVKEINELKSSPYDIGLCLDYSGSMCMSIQPLENAVRKFLNKKDDADRMSLVRFDDKLKTEKKLTFSINELIKDIEWKGLDKFGGSTALYAGIDEALETFDSTATANNRQKNLFIFTDGNENSSFSHASKGRLFRAIDLARKARKRGIKLYPMGLGDGVNVELLNALGWITDGKAMIIPTDSLIDEAYSELPRLFKNYYEITYKPIVSGNKEEGKRQIGLKYFNNRKTITTFTNYQTNDKFKFDDYEQSYYNTSTINQKGVKMNKKIIVPPQAIAFFDFDRANLKPTFTANIESVIGFLKSNPNAKADIFGHTDLVGTSEKNMILSGQRANEIKQYFIKKGIDPARLEVYPLGKSQPIWRQEKEKWQAQENRRIEILIWE